MPALRTRPGSPPPVGARSRQRANRARALGAVVGLGALVALGETALSAGAASGPAPQVTHLTGTLAPANGSGVSGSVSAELRGTALTISVTAHGQTPGQARIQHLHLGGEFRCPPPGLGGTGVGGHLRTTDAKPYHGPVAVSLTTSGDTSPASELDTPRFPVGDAHYRRTITVSAQVARDLRAGHGVLELHGVDYNHDGRFDGAARSDLDPKLPEEATDPSACARLTTRAG